MNEKTIKKLPLGITDFKEIIESGCVYVDKTAYIYQMITSGKYYFISRPRRFGKSLLVSTLAELFTGNKKLFEQSWIANSDYNWQEYPVIKIDFSGLDYSTSERLEKSLIQSLQTTATEYNVVPANTDSPKDMFSALIDQLAKKNKVVILVDEYDKPIIDNIHDSQQAEKQRFILQNFYVTIKAKDAVLRFVLLTGVSKFAKTSVFSGLNNLTDISMDERYATLLGYMQQEIRDYLDYYITRLSKKQKTDYEETMRNLTNYYDGYQFVENTERVFNPYSVLRCCDEGKYKNYWFETGTPTFLIKLLQKNNYRPEAFISPELNEGSLGSFEPGNIPLSALLFQTGYLTIKKYDSKTGNYTLGIPNTEVNSGLTINLADAFTQLPPDESLQYARRITHMFVKNDMVELQVILQEFFNRMPYTVHITDESKLQFVLYAICALIGVAVDPEVTTSIGRADLIVTFPKHVFVIELKFNKTAQEALVQIQDKRYYEKYENLGKKITLLGINFDAASKAVALKSMSL